MTLFKNQAEKSYMAVIPGPNVKHLFQFEKQGRTTMRNQYCLDKE